MEFVENREVEKEQLKAIFRDMVKYSPSKIVGMLGNAIIVPVYTSLLTPDQYGLYSLSIAVLSFLCIIFSDWVGLSGLRFFKHHQMSQDMPKYLTTLVTMLSTNLVLMFVLALTFRHNFYSFFHIPVKYFSAHNSSCDKSFIVPTLESSIKINIIYFFNNNKSIFDDIVINLFC